MMSIGFIGFGNMAQAIARGLLSKQVLRPEQIYACAKNYEKLCANTQPQGMIPCHDSLELVQQCEVVVIAVKPYLVEEVIAPIKELLQSKLVISVVAGYPFHKYEEVLLPNTAHLSTIPNTPVAVGEGVFVCESKHSLSEQQMKVFKDIFAPIALLQFVETAQLSVAGTLSGCGPAFVSLFMEALGDAGVKHGLSREVAYALASQMLVGTGKLQLEIKAHPGVMKDAVCSPGGTTIVGVATLEKNGFRSAVIEAIDAIENK